MGFEPTNNGFAIRPLSPLGYSAAAATRNCSGHGELGKRHFITPRRDAFSRCRAVTSALDRTYGFCTVTEASVAVVHVVVRSSAGDAQRRRQGPPRGLRARIRRRSRSPGSIRSMRSTAAARGERPGHARVGALCVSACTSTRRSPVTIRRCCGMCSARSCCYTLSRGRTRRSHHAETRVRHRQTRRPDRRRRGGRRSEALRAGAAPHHRKKASRAGGGAVAAQPRSLPAHLADPQARCREGPTHLAPRRP